MYYFLTKKLQQIDGSQMYQVQLEYYDEINDNYSIARIYVRKTEENEQKLSYFSKHDDITSYIGSRVRNDGKVVLTLK